jgi:hypothetical protein
MIPRTLSKHDKNCAGAGSEMLVGGYYGIPGVQYTHFYGFGCHWRQQAHVRESLSQLGLAMEFHYEAIRISM